MKKILSFIVLFFITVGVTFGYNPTSKDEKLLNSVYKKLDIVVKKSPSKLEKLHNKIVKLKEKVKNKDRIIYLLTELENYSYKLLTDRNNVEYLVKEVIDGDTIKINYLGKNSNVRFVGIDTPESYATRFGYKECYGDEAKDYLKNLLEGKKIKLEIDNSQGRTDKYNRLLGYVIYNGENINNKLISEGYAWEYTYNKAYKYQDLFKESEKNASNSKKGLWAENTCNGERVKIEVEEKVKEEVNTNYSCGAKMYCTQMTTCEEARYYLNSCNLQRLDKDGDGTPCESLCGQ